MNIAIFEKRPLLGILRGIGSEDVEPLCNVVMEAGLPALEITMNTDGAPQLIKKLAETAGERMAVGAGTVLTLDECKTALESGATFIVSPVVIPEVMEYCVKHKIPVFPGAFTPQEIYNAWQSGATMVKVFPVKPVGPGYIKEIKGPFANIKLLACGGVSDDTIGSFFENGASACAFGGSIFKKEWIEAKEYNKIGQCISSLINSMKAG